jgi:Family of unknown function (DUF6492)
MNCDIFIRSYYKDLEWLELCVASIATYCRGFRAVVVVVPRSSRPWLERRRGLPATVRLEWCPDYRDDYLGQQVTKLYADTLTDADFVCHVDSDCIFCRPIAPDELVDEGGRPRMVTRPYARLDRHVPWRRPTEAFLGWTVDHHFMQRPPFTFPRWLYAEVRRHAVDTHGTDLDRYVLTRPPRGFSEFNVLGAFAHARYRDRFVWLEDSLADLGPPVCCWYWSWGGLDGGVRGEIEAILSPTAARDSGTE